MANSIEINCEQLLKKKDELKTSSTKILELINKQDKLLGNLVDESIWKGPSRNAVLDKKSEIKTQTNKLKDILDKYNVYLEAVASRYLELDKFLYDDLNDKVNK